MMIPITILGSMKPTAAATPRRKFLTISPAMRGKLQMISVCGGFLISFAGLCLGADAVTAIGAVIAMPGITADMKGGEA